MCKVRFIIATFVVTCWLRVANGALGLGSTPSARSRRKVSPVPDRLVKLAPKRLSYYASNWIKPIPSSKNCCLHYHTKSPKSSQAPSAR